MAKKENEGEEEANPTDGVPIQWYFPEGLIRRYANNMIVQRLDSEFVVSFFETIPPPLIGSIEERKKQAEEVKSIKAVCVASIIISPPKMPAFIQVLQENFNRFIAQLKKEQEEAQQEEGSKSS